MPERILAVALLLASLYLVTSIANDEPPTPLLQAEASPQPEAEGASEETPEDARPREPLRSRETR